MQHDHPEDVGQQAASTTLRQLDRRLERIEGMIERLIKLEVDHGNSKAAIERAFQEIGKLEARLVPLEAQAPIVQLIEQLVERTVWTILAATLAIGLALIAPAWYREHSGPPIKIEGPR